MIICTLSVYGALLIECRAHLSVYRAFLSDHRAQQMAFDLSLRVGNDNL